MRPLKSGSGTAWPIVRARIALPRRTVNLGPAQVLTGPPAIGGVVVPRALIARCSLRLLLQIVRQPAKFIRDVRRTEGNIAQRSCRLAEKFGQIFWHGGLINMSRRS